MNELLNIQGKLGEDISKIYLEAIGNGQIEKVYVKYANGTVKSIDATNIDNKTISDTLKNIGAKASTKGSLWFVATKENIPENIINAPVVEENLDLGLNNQIEEDTVVDLDTVKNIKYDENKVNGLSFSLKKGLLTAGLVAGIGITAGSAIPRLQGCGWFNQEKEATVTTEITIDEPEEVETPVVEEMVELSLKGKDWNYFLDNSIEFQRNYWSTNHDFVMEFNVSEPWMEPEVTEQLKEMLDKAGVELTGDIIRFGFTAEEIHAIRTLYSEFTNEEMTTINGGEFINTVNMLNSSESDLNKAFRKIQIWYWLSDNQYNPIVNLCGFNDDEVNKIHEYEDYLFQYKNLLKEGKDKEAEELMHKIRDDIYTYGYAQNDGQDKAKPFILKTYLPAVSAYAHMYQYKDTVTLHLFDVIEQKDTDKDIQTILFDDVMMHDLVEGYKGCVDSDGEVLQESFNVIEYLKSFNIDTKRYTLVVSDDGISKADQFNSELVDKLNQYNDFVSKLRVENTAADAAHTSDSVKPISDNSELDSLIKGCYVASEINEVINDDLDKNNKYPMNINYFPYEFARKLLLDQGFIDENGNYITGKPIIKMVYVPGHYIVRTVTHTWTETYTETFSVREKVSASDIAKEDAINRKKAVEEASKTTVTDGETGKDKETTYQDIYNKVWNDNTDQSKQATNLDNNDKVKDNDSIAKEVEKIAKEDAADNKKQNEEAAKDAKESYTDAEGNNHYISGGNERKEEQYQNADSATESEAERYNREHGITVNSAPAPVETPASAPVVETPAPAPVAETPAPVVEESAPESYGDSYDTEGFAPVMDDSSESEIDDEIGRSL